MPTKKSRKPMKAAPGTDGRRRYSKLSMREINAVIAELRAGGASRNDTPVELTITLLPTDVAWLNRLAAEQHCSIEEILTKAVWLYRYGGHNQLLEEDREYLTKAIAESTDRFKTGRYEINSSMALNHSPQLQYVSSSGRQKWAIGLHRSL
jgi:hypothetical protein